MIDKVAKDVVEELNFMAARWHDYRMETQYLYNRIEHHLKLNKIDATRQNVVAVMDTIFRLYRDFNIDLVNAGHIRIIHKKGAK